MCCPKLTHLGLAYCGRVTDSGIRAIILHCRRILVLDLYWCLQVGAAAEALHIGRGERGERGEWGELKEAAVGRSNDLSTSGPGTSGSGTSGRERRETPTIIMPEDFIGHLFAQFTPYGHGVV